MKRLIILAIIAVLFQNCKESSYPTTSENELKYEIVFTSDRDSDGRIHIELGSKNEIYSMSIDGSNQTRLTNNDRFDFVPRYSNDGNRIVYTSAVDWLQSDIVLMNNDGSNSINLGRGEHPIFSNDNSKILYKTDGLIGIINPDGSNKVVLTNWADSIYSTAGQDYPVQFSSDDSKILFISRINNNADIYVMSTDGDNVKRLTSNPGYDGNCSFSNDDSKILFSSYRNGVSQIYIMNSDGSNEVQLTTTEKYNNKAKFSPDGNRIVFHSGRNGREEFYIMNIDGTNQRRLTNNNSLKYNFSFSPDGKYIVYSQMDKENLNENKSVISLLNIESGEIVNLTNNESNNFSPSFSPILN